MLILNHVFFQSRLWNTPSDELLKNFTVILFGFFSSFSWKKSLLNEKSDFHVCPAKEATLISNIRGASYFLLQNAYWKTFFFLLLYTPYWSTAYVKFILCSGLLFLKWCLFWLIIFKYSFRADTLVCVWLVFFFPEKRARLSGQILSFHIA